MKQLGLGGPAKNTAQLVTLFALSNLWMARRHMMEDGDECVHEAPGARAPWAKARFM